MATKRPLVFAGAISEIYMGATIEEAPTPSPPIKRKIINVVTSCAMAAPIDDTK